MRSSCVFVCLYGIQCKVTYVCFSKVSHVLVVRRVPRRTDALGNQGSLQETAMFNKPCGWRVYACKHTHIVFSVCFRVCACAHSSRRLVLAWWQSRIILPPGEYTHFAPGRVAEKCDRKWLDLIREKVLGVLHCGAIWR